MTLSDDALYARETAARRNAERSALLAMEAEQKRRVSGHQSFHRINQASRVSQESADREQQRRIRESKKHEESVRAQHFARQKMAREAATQEQLRRIRNLKAIDEDEKRIRRMNEHVALKLMDNERDRRSSKNFSLQYENKLARRESVRKAIALAEAEQKRRIQESHSADLEAHREHALRKSLAYELSESERQRRVSNPGYDGGIGVSDYGIGRVNDALTSEAVGAYVHVAKSNQKKNRTRKGKTSSKKSSTDDQTIRKLVQDVAEIKSMLKALCQSQNIRM